MAKKMFVPVQKNSKSYKLFLDDVAKVYQIKKSVRPPVPSYNCMDSPSMKY